MLDIRAGLDQDRVHIAHEISLCLLVFRQQMYGINDPKALVLLHYSKDTHLEE